MAAYGVWKQTAVPADKVDDVVAGFQLDKPVRVDTVDNGDGTFDVIATFPSAPEQDDSNRWRDP